MFVIYLLLLSFVYAVPRRYNYNCFSMYAELFPVEKIPLNYGNRSYVIGGKEYDDLQANIPKYLQRSTKLSRSWIQFLRILMIGRRVIWLF